MENIINYSQTFEELEKENQRLRERCEALKEDIDDLNLTIEHFRNEF